MQQIESKSHSLRDTPAGYSRALHALSVLTAAATLLLIFMGGLVTSHGAGMSVPDWPNSYGYNMFTFPPSKWVGGIFYEHTHRLMGTVVGMLSIAMVIAAFKVEHRSWMKNLAISILLAVIIQGVLGGLRVVLIKLGLAIVHGIAAQTCLCLMAVMVVATSKWWLEAPFLSRLGQQIAGRRLIGLAVACAIAIFAQLIVGALMRHNEAGLAIPDLPLAYGNVLAPTDNATLATANQQRVAMNLPPVTLAQVWLHFGHRIGAVIVSGLVIALAIVCIRQVNPSLRRLGIALLVLLVAQLTLGVLTVLWRKPADVASLHVVTGALTLMTTVIVLLRSMRLYSPLWRAPRGFEIEFTPDHPIAAV